MVGNTEIEEWLSCEISGYPLEIPVALDRLISDVNRRFRVPAVSGEAGPDLLRRMEGFAGNDPEDVRTRRESLPEIEDIILPAHYRSFKDYPAQAQRVAQAKERNAFTLGKFGLTPPRVKATDPQAVESFQRRAASEIRELEGIARKVRARIHRWVVSEMHRLAFVDVLEATFSRYKADLHRALTSVAPEVAEKIPAVYERLRSAPDDQEAASQAMATCRRMIASLADALCPASPQPITDDDGTEHKVTQQQSKNRLQEFIKTRCSRSRADRLRKSLDVIFEKLSGGLKAEGFSLEDAEPLFLHTYLILGEIASLPSQARG